MEGAAEERLCAEFRSITGADRGLAKRYLGRAAWDLQHALNTYFEGDTDPGSSVASAMQPPPVEVLDVSSDLEVIEENSLPPNLHSASGGDEGSLSLLCWNLDGLMEEQIQLRARGACNIIALHSPDVVYLQELVPPYLGYLQQRATSYHIIPADEQGYFTAVMLKKSRVRLISHEVIPFPTSVMGRNLLAVRAEVSGVPLYLLTSHLESTVSHTKERVRQLQQVLQRIALAPSNATTIFGGDTNLRDKEVSQIGGLPPGVGDVWELLGRPEETRYTWDTTLNDNLKLGGARSSRLRFDRLFYQQPLTARSPGPSSPPGGGGGGVDATVVPRSLRLVGTERLACGKFPSDHWGLLAHFDLVL
ncbi:tyrosyl-DNA phosphodiesterase 2-like [Lampetra fluviatilis]